MKKNVGSCVKLFPPSSDTKWIAKLGDEMSHVDERSAGGVVSLRRFERGECHISIVLIALCFNLLLSIDCTMLYWWRNNES